MPEINPAVLVWARESAGLTVAKAAKSLALGGSKSSPEEALLQYEQGRKEVSRALLAKMASTYRRPLLVFYLPKPPIAAEKGEDFRTVPEEIRLESKGSLDALVRDIFVRKELIRDVLKDIEEAQPKAYVKSLSLEFSVPDAAIKLSSIINFNLLAFRKCAKPEDAFSYLRKRVEDIGIYVLLIGNLGSHHTNIPVEAFRGFALADEIAPIIVINDQDAPAARSFTLLHEVAHILLGATGLSGSRAETKIERYCNDIASITLMPSGEIEAFDWPIHDEAMLIRSISGRARDINVSGSMVAYRLYSAGIIGIDTWTSVSDKLRKLWLMQKAAQKEGRGDGSGPSYYVVKRHKVGGAIIDLVNRTMREGVLTATKASKVLGVKPANVYNLVGI